MRLAIQREIQAAWVAAIAAFYQASERADPSYGPLLASVVVGGPAAEQEVSYIAAQEASGVQGPSSWQLAAGAVSNLVAASAVVTGCTYDPGSVVAATRAPAPPALGGGAGATEFVSEMEEVEGRWRLLKSTTSPLRGGLPACEQ